MAGRPRVPSATRPPEVDADWQSQANRRGPGVDQRRGDEAAAAAEIRYGTCGGRRPDAHATWRRSVETVQHSRAIFQSTNIIGYSIITNFPFSFGTITTPRNSVNSLGDKVEISFPVFASGIDTTGQGIEAKWAGEKVTSAAAKEIILLNKFLSQNPPEWRAVARVKRRQVRLR